MGLKKQKITARQKLHFYPHITQTVYTIVSGRLSRHHCTMFSQTVFAFSSQKIAVLLLMPGNDFSTAGESQAQLPICREHRKQNDDKKSCVRQSVLSVYRKDIAFIVIRKFTHLKAAKPRLAS